MLTDEQKKLITKGLSKGVADTQIAKSIGVKHMQVYMYRKTLGVSREEVVEARYDTWIRLLESGTELETVAAMYEVKPDSVLSTLYRKRNFSYPEAKKRGQRNVNASLRKALGVTLKDVQEKKVETWLRLFDSGMAIESIADLYDVKPATVRSALRKVTEESVPAPPKQEHFDW
ncbi:MULTISPECIES: hypothetical protein [Burkholderia]|uniref:Helix-turn-helix domain-containing protein n=1 Tax=Burkholderia stagnalis TaxID=1503054 RepID=A0ABX9YQC4_9BURK|nr:MULTISPECIES: hypothetical protein [Burkholderia]KGC70269.1 helix-turn-helix domain of resolvase family protein [Burkholderia pseudomallei]KWK60916.1 hypothetical protein WT82_29850 [Burkholderia stagnalis]MDD1494002.1 hypothetical protein [Burkholderia thailandensis]MPV65589.1 hypothetical protein [Burkholderia sp. BE17]RQY93764.1 hypothetical protein DF017_12035 [Burkholderia stagnalis]